MSLVTCEKNLEPTIFSGLLCVIHVRRCLMHLKPSKDVVVGIGSGVSVDLSCNKNIFGFLLMLILAKKNGDY